MLISCSDMEQVSGRNPDHFSQVFARRNGPDLSFLI
jgi:hypothetical protein